MSEIVKIDDVVVRTIDPVPLSDFLDSIKHEERTGLVLWTRSQLYKNTGMFASPEPAEVKEEVILVGDVNGSCGTCSCCGYAANAVVYAWGRVDMVDLKEVKL